MSDQEVLGSSSREVPLFFMGSPDCGGQAPGESKNYKMIPTSKVFPYCGPEMESCVGNQTLKDKESCLVPCSGLYADVVDNPLKKPSEDFENIVIKGRFCVSISLDP